MIENAHRRPVIGLTADTEPRKDSEAESIYLLRRNYASAVARSGGVPVILPHDVSLAELYVAQLDGLIITGGMFDIDPRRYGAMPKGSLNTKEERTDFEIALIQCALQSDLPILGICNGMQLLAVALGGTLVQDIPCDIDGALEHMPELPATASHHPVHFEPGSTLTRVTGKSRADVNSVHHQSVKESLAYVVAAKAPDGVVEAIEVPGRHFCLGLQWHPEYGASDADALILNAFVAACSERTRWRVSGVRSDDDVFG